MASGYLYLLSLLLLLGHRIPDQAEVHEPLKLLYGVAGWIGRPAALATSAFVAYVLGSVLEVHAANLPKFFRNARSRLGSFHRKLSRLPPKVQYMMEPDELTRAESFLQVEAARAELTKPAVDGLLVYIADRLGYEGGRRGRAPFALHPLIQDLPQLRTRLYGSSKDLYGDYDRLAAEADFKVNVGGAAIILCCVAAILVEPWWALLSGPMAFLIYRDLSTTRQANDVLVQAIVTGVVKSPKFEEIISEMKARADRP
ncbi:hypothetical protein [Streptomyces sp. NPDC053079]|uniref:hypothetical protein n=1 Tax=Streptomyces sp. NPDC053079 TaxID=3365697 RepID=UPI0037CE1009